MLLDYLLDMMLVPLGVGYVFNAIVATVATTRQLWLIVWWCGFLIGYHLH